ncbi:MAG: ABC transporter ATP-binding protein [Actinobacteria bacterium]|nr:ABC transporter ATP-binding protein [Actinomycetota bacterium]
MTAAAPETAFGPRPTQTPLLEVDNIEVLYGVSLAVRGISFTVPENGVVAILGPNGAGKTSTIRAITGLLAVHHGSIRDGDIRLRGKSIKGMRPDRIVGSGLAQVPEGRHVFKELTVEENLRVGAAARKGGGIDDTMTQVFDLFPRLKERIKQQAGWLSGGEQQMVAIGRGLMADPKLLLLDEVSLGLAPLVIEDIFERLGEVRRDLGTSMLLVEQNARVALAFADYGYILESGRIVLEGRSGDLRDNPTVKESYLGVRRDGEGAGFGKQKHYRRRGRWLS